MATVSLVTAACPPQDPRRAISPALDAGGELQPVAEEAPKNAEDAGRSAQSDVSAVSPLAAAPSLEGPALRALVVPGFAPAVVSVPVGTTEPQRVLVAAHGNYDKPEWQCETWREILGGEGFVLCPRGVARRDSPGPSDTRFEYRTSAELGREIDAGINALRAQFPGRIVDGPMVFAGFSLGALYGVDVVAHEPERFPHVVLIEVGHDRWSPSVLASFTSSKTPERRVLYVCGSPGCVASSQVEMTKLTKAGVSTRLVASPREGHTYGGKVAEAIKSERDWFFSATEMENLSR